MSDPPWEQDMSIDPRSWGTAADPPRDPSAPRVTEFKAEGDKVNWTGYESTVNEWMGWAADKIEGLRAELNRVQSDFVRVRAEAQVASGRNAELEEMVKQLHASIALRAKTTVEVLELGTKVEIIGSEGVVGVVNAITVDRRGTLYRVAWWNDGLPYNDLFPRELLKLVDDEMLPVTRSIGT